VAGGLTASGEIYAELCEVPSLLSLDIVPPRIVLVVSVSCPFGSATEGNKLRVCVCERERERDLNELVNVYFF